MKKVIVLLLLAVVGYSLAVTYANIEFGASRLGNIEQKNNVGSFYLTETVKNLSVANVVTAIVVNYRGFDTLGEVTVLFLAASALGSILYRKREKGEHDVMITKSSSQLLQTGAKLIFPAILVLGSYVFIHGHLTPGGGFQGGAIIATGFLLMFMSYKDYHVSHSILMWVESIAGVLFVSVGFWGLITNASFLQNTLEPGMLNDLVSGGIIPIIYIAVGFKVAAELTGVLETLLNFKSNR